MQHSGNQLAEAAQAAPTSARIDQELDMEPAALFPYMPEPLEGKQHHPLLGLMLRQASSSTISSSGRNFSTTM